MKFLYPLHNPSVLRDFYCQSPLGDPEALTKLQTMGKQELVIKILSFCYSCSSFKGWWS